MKRTRMLGALMDEYERSTIDLKKILTNLSQEEFKVIKDSKTENPDCRSIQTLLFHMVQSGYTYANYINTIYDGEWLEYKKPITTPQESIQELDQMLAYTDQALMDKYNKSSDEINSWSFDTRWGTTFNIEQLLSHAIVHILRHRRQVEGFLKKKI